MSNHPNEYLDPIVTVSVIIALLKELPSNYDEAYSMLEQTELEKQDLLHEVELLALSKEEAASVIETMRENRRNRRKAKDFMNLARPLYEVVREHPSLLPELVQAHSSMLGIQRSFKERIYAPRVRNEHADAFVQLTARASGVSPEDIRRRMTKSGGTEHAEPTAR